jgi:hypothetical protein
MGLQWRGGTGVQRDILGSYLTWNTGVGAVECKSFGTLF